MTQWVTRRELLPCGCADDPAAAHNNPTEMSIRFVYSFLRRAQYLFFFFVLASILCPGGNIIHTKAGCSYHLSAVINHWLFVVSYPFGGGENKEKEGRRRIFVREFFPAIIYIRVLGMPMSNSLVTRVCSCRADSDQSTPRSRVWWMGLFYQILHWA